MKNQIKDTDIKKLGIFIYDTLKAKDATVWAAEQNKFNLCKKKVD